MAKAKEEEVLTLTVPQIKDYMVCELFYNYRYQEKLYERVVGRELMAQRFESTLKKVVSFFFYKKQANITPSYNALLNRWEKLWFPKDMTAYDIAVEQHEIAHNNMLSFSNIAAVSLERFYNDFAKDEGVPMLIDESYLVPLGDKVRLRGSMDLVLRSKGNYKVIKWSARTRKPGGMNSLMLEFAGQRIAYDHRNNESPRPVRFTLYNLHENPGFQTVEQPNSDEMKALIYWAKEMRDNEHYVPRRGYTAYCKSCPFDLPCANFKDWPTSL
jgi:hypothetical protein